MMGATTPETCRVALQYIIRLLIVASRWTIIDKNKKSVLIAFFHYVLHKNVFLPYVSAEANTRPLINLWHTTEQRTNTYINCTLGAVILLCFQNYAFDK